MNPRSHLDLGPLKTRDTPRQQRARDRVHQILHAAATILTHTPPHAISTTQIADTAGIPVSSIYRYFPKIEDVFDELYQQISGEFEARVLALFDDLETYPGWRDRHRGVYATFRIFCAEHPYYLALLQASIARTGPETIELGHASGITRFLAERWAGGGDGFRGGDPYLVSHMTMQIFLSIEGFVAANVGQSDVDRFFDELSLNLESYLANYLDDER